MSVQGPQNVVVVVKFGFAFLLVSFLPWIKVCVCVCVCVMIILVFALMKDVIDGIVALPILNSILQSNTATDDTLYHWMYTHRYVSQYIIHTYGVLCLSTDDTGWNGICLCDV